MRVAISVSLWYVPLTYKTQSMSVLFDLFIGMEPTGRFRLLTPRHVVTQWFVLFQTDSNFVFLYLVIHKKTPIDTDATRQL